MYAIYVNDVFNVTDFMKCILYADDTVIIISTRTKDELFTLATRYLTLYSKRFAIKKLCLNDNKTHFIIFGPVGNDNIDIIIFDDHIVKRVNEIRYLGIIIDDHLCWKSQINCVHDKVARGVGKCLICAYLNNVYLQFIIHLYSHISNTVLSFEVLPIPHIYNHFVYSKNAVFV